MAEYIPQSSAFGPNQEEFDWRLAQGGSLATLDQLLRSGLGPSRQVVEAHYTALQGHTDIVIKNPPPQPVIRRPGLDLLDMLTARGRLSIQY